MVTCDVTFLFRVARNFTVLRRFATKNRNRNDFPSLLCFSYQGGLPNSKNFAKIAKTRSPTIFYTVTWYFFLLFGLSHLPDGASELNNFCEKVKKLGPQRFFVLNDFSLFLSFSLTNRGFQSQLIPRKVRKIVPFSLFTIFP